SRGASVIIWPETSTPFFYEEDAVGRQAVQQLARDTRTHLIIGSDQFERGGPEPRVYNAAFVVSPAGETTAVYRKMPLGPFGEYVPLKRVLFFAAPLVETVSDFSPGLHEVLLPVAG